MNLDEEKKVMERLKKEYKNKEKFFTLLKQNKNRGALSLVENDNNLKTYFMKFKFKPDKPGVLYGKVLSFGDGTGLNVSYNNRYENEIQEDLDRCKKEIFDREYLLQQKEFLEQQKEFLKFQKEDIKENKVNREKITKLTLIIALGVVATSIYYIFETMIRFETSQTLHILLISGISCLGLTLVFIFIIHMFSFKDSLVDFWKQRWLWILFLGLLILIFGLLLMFSPDRQTSFAEESVSSVLTKTNVLINKTNEELSAIYSMINELSQNSKETLEMTRNVFYLQINSSNR